MWQRTNSSSTTFDLNAMKQHIFILLNRIIFLLSNWCHIRAHSLNNIIQNNGIVNWIVIINTSMYTAFNRSSILVLLKRLMNCIHLLTQSETDACNKLRGYSTFRYVFAEHMKLNLLHTLALCSSISVHIIYEYCKRVGQEFVCI